MMSQNCYESFMKIFVGDILQDELRWRKFLRRDNIGQRCSRIPLIIASVAKCVKLL